ncbi:HNH endonuclease [Paenibacillus polymyxa]|uniref:HNH endonuclease n=1 Tax=Paenibacillus polymyxa TaxID=1406 RepID=UPI0025B6AE9A|nr:HNH endonuclease [Paenibacillus polymyxa]MDN4085928.1 HNH endonuclease [Paenibacillus polymyxa]MDN4111830.1 HNH endonuclease [Paenibacillus polymyxa]
MARKKMLHKLVPEKYGVDLETFLRQAYFDRGLDQYKIAEILGCTAGAICLWFSKFNIQTHPNGTFQKGRKLSPEHIDVIKKTHTGKNVSKETREKLSKARRGISYIGKSPHFTGKRLGRTDGYIQLYKPDHPNASKEGYVMEHRFIMEQKLGRYLTQKEEVHHINHVRNDNRIENLHLFSSKEDHQRFHMKKRHEERRNKNVN